MKRHAHAVLAGHLIGLTCIGASLPMLFRLIGTVAEYGARSLRLPDNPGEAGYLWPILDGIVNLVAETLSLIFSLGWMLTDGATMVMFVIGVLLMFTRPRWIVGLIGRNMT